MLPKVTTWRCGKMLLLSTLCPITVFAVMNVLNLMKRRNTSVNIGHISHSYQHVPMMSVLINSWPTFVCSLGFRIFPAIKPSCIKSSLPACLLNCGQMDHPDSEMLAIWQNVLPKEELIKACKRPRSEEGMAPKRSRGRVSNKDPEVDPNTKELLHLLARLAIRHEDSIQVMLQQQQFILHLKSGQGSILPALMLKSQEWHLEKDKSFPLRCCLAQLMMETLQERASKLIQASPSDEIFKASLKQNMVLEAELEPSIQEASGEQGQSPHCNGTDRNSGGNHPDPSGVLQCIALSRPEETSTRPRSSSQCSVSLGHDRDSGPSPALAEIVLSQHLASRGCGSEAPNSNKDSVSKASGTAPPPKTIRICTNRPGLYCWLNAIFIALCWQGLVTMYPLVAWIDTCWAFRELTQFTFAPLALHFGDASFDELMRDWVSRHNWLAQQDAVDFLCYVLPILCPCFYCGKWLPKWSADQPMAMDDAENDEKGDTFAPIMISICLPVPDFTLQDFVSWWHDVSGHQRVMLGAPLGTCIYLDRMQHDPSYHKDSREVYLSDFCLLPCYIDGQVQWISYHIIGVTYHTGDDFQQGHWQSSLWQGPPYRRWLHYDDGKVPTVSTSLTPHIHQNWCLAWLALDPKYS